MEVTKTIGPALTTPARTMTAEAMQQDLEYEMFSCEALEHLHDLDRG